MATYPLIDIITTTDPPADSAGVPLRNTVSILFDREMNEDLLEEEFFVEGPDTDAYVGPGMTNLTYPPNTSEGEDDDFLESPGFRGIVQGAYTFKKIDPVDPDSEVADSPYRTKVIFTSDHALAALTLYKAHLPQAWDLNDNLYSGYITWEFTTGSGSIVEVPSTASTSVLTSLTALNPLESQIALSIVKTTPADHAVKVELDTNEIRIEFNKNIDEATVADNVSVVASPVIEHPNLDITSAGELAKTFEVNGKILKIRI